jgi:hypothetical protein
MRSAGGRDLNALPPRCPLPQVKAPPPVLAPADAKKRAKEAKETKRAGAAAMQD